MHSLVCEEVERVDILVRMSAGRDTLRDRFFAWRIGVPLGTRVDPALFPEDEYPVHCLVCGYALRGLTDNRCPECGEEFTRGHLLVELYVRRRRPRSDQWCSITKFLSVFAIIAIVTPVPMLCCLHLWAKLTSKTMEEVFDARGVELCFGVAGALFYIGIIAGVSKIIISRTIAPPAKKRRAIRNAIPKQ